MRAFDTLFMELVIAKPVEYVGAGVLINGLNGIVFLRGSQSSLSLQILVAFSFRNKVIKFLEPGS